MAKSTLFIVFIVVAAIASCCLALPAPESTTPLPSDAVRIVSQGPAPISTYETLFQWKSLQFDFPSDEVREAKLKSGEFIPENCTLAGIKVHDSRIFLTVPRWRKGIPATLVYVDYSNGNGTYSTTGNGNQGNFDQSLTPKLKPYPSWAAQQIGNCSAFQYVQSMEIDQFNRMWAIDVGRVDTKSYDAATSPEQCPPKLSIINLTTNQIEHTYEFPEQVVDMKKNFLNDIVVGCFTQDECMAYITDAWTSRLVMYDFKDNSSWSVTHETMHATPDAFNVTILGTTYPTEVNIDGIALSPIDTKFSTLYYCPLSSYNLYTVDTATLLKYKTSNEGNPVQLQDDEVTLLGQKSSHSDGLAMSSSGYLYYGQLENNSISYINLTSAARNRATHKSISEVLLLASDIDLQWPDTLAFDNAGYLYTVSNRLQRFIGGGYDPEEFNLNIVRTWLGLKSYQHSGKEPIVAISIEQANSATTPSTTTTTTTESPTSSPGDDPDDASGEHDHDSDRDHDKSQADPPQSLPNKEASTEKDEHAKAHGNNLLSSVGILLISALAFF